MGYGLGSTYGLGTGIAIMDILGLLTGLGIFFLILLYFLEGLGLMKLFEKAGLKQGMAFVPFYRHYLKYNMVWENKGWLGVVISILSLLCTIAMSYFMLYGSLVISVLSKGSTNMIARNAVGSQLANTSFVLCSLGIVVAGIFMINLFMYYKMTRSFVSERNNFPSIGMFAGLVLLPVLFLLILGFSKDYSYRGISTGSVGDNFYDDMLVRRKRSIKRQPSYMGYKQQINNLDPALRQTEFEKLETQTAHTAEEDTRRYICVASYVSCALLVLAWYFGGSLVTINYVSFGCVGFALAFINYNRTEKPLSNYQIIPMVLNAVLVVAFSIASIL